MLRSFAITAMIWLMTMHASSAAGPGTGPGGLAGSAWRVTEHKGQAVDVQPEWFVQFSEDGQFSGFAGCNRFFGDFKENGQEISIGPLASTRKFCSPTIMKGEAALMKTLQQARRFNRNKSRLLISDETGLVLARFAQRDS